MSSAVSATARPALKQWMTPGKAPFPASSRRIRQVSSSAERVCTISGSPVCLRRRDVLPKTRLLLRPRAVVVMKSSPVSPMPMTLGCAAMRTRWSARHRRLLGHVVRVDPDRAPDPLVRPRPERERYRTASPACRSSAGCRRPLRPHGRARPRCRPQNPESRDGSGCRPASARSPNLRSPGYPPRIAGKPAQASAAACRAQAARPRRAPQAPRASAATPSWSSIRPLESGMNAWVSTARWRRVSITT